ncbi:phage regulatory CII family protein [Shewanella marina]|uniref:phage regulatory CII family protein n=1 Tax=Shewanella marina TaxID=487319 RepID=UPI000471926F|nr:phage regulatory CII family protein [Shewanella marina]
MYNDDLNKHKAEQPYVARALRQFALSETLSELAVKSKIAAQMLRNKLLLNQPHQLTVHELVRITKVSGNRAIVDGILRELDCLPSVRQSVSADEAKVPLTERALEISTNAGVLGSIALDIKAQNRVTERTRNSAVSRATVVFNELALFIHDVEQKFQAVPVLSVASDTLQTLPMPGM